jgi:uncharacterized protein YecE (DUF72 family)
MRWHVGTSGYSYKEWKGNFYPEKLPAKDMLSYYAQRLPAVEVNNTFYRMPKTSVLETWGAQVPETFRFVLKASQRITHFKRLKETEEVTGYLWNAASTLGDKLGVFLFQLPPNFRKDLERLTDFLANLPDPTRAAFEFRHESWFDDEVYDALRSAGTAFCIADDDGAAEPASVISTASWGYLRLRRESYSESDLDAWARRIRDHSWESAYVFFKHEDAGAGPRMAARFLELSRSA